MSKIVEVNVQSEIGKLNGVILHTPGEEVENMTPENAERALYSDILNLSIARKEYKQLSEVLGKITKTYQVKDLPDKHFKRRCHQTGSVEPHRKDRAFYCRSNSQRIN